MGYADAFEYQVLVTASAPYNNKNVFAVNHLNIYSIIIQDALRASATLLYDGHRVQIPYHNYADDAALYTGVTTSTDGPEEGVDRIAFRSRLEDRAMWLVHKLKARDLKLFWDPT